MGGLTKQEIHTIREVAKRFPEIERVLLFGSRARSNHQSGSDIDLAIAGEKLTPEIQLRFRQILEEETTIPYFFDVVLLNQNLNPDLKHDIEQNNLQIF